ncbi:unnamed protein product [marine sediment metagenome]|uniref:Uncharacterized protein n=1 Tax=marine sediment metagenome TaxID=412755 RepID=X0ZQP2_9ZZZZ
MNKNRKIYKCKKCGNIDYFYGYVSEGGKVHISQYEDGQLSWAYMLSDDDAYSEVTPEVCSVCQSSEIEEIRFSNINLDLNNIKIKGRKV